MKSTLLKIMILLFLFCASGLTVFSQSSKIAMRVLEFSPDGNWIVGGYVGGKIELLNADGQLQHTFRTNGKAVMSLDWSPDSQFVVSGDYDGLVEIWDISDLSLERTLRSGGGEIISVSWNPDVNYPYIAGVSQQEAVTYVWNAVSGNLEYTIQSGTTIEAAWNMNGNYLATAGAVLKIWNAADGNLFKDMTGPNYDIYLEWSPTDSEAFVTTAYSTSAKAYLLTVYNLNADQKLKTITGFAEILAPVRWSPDGSKIAAASRDGTIRIWNVSGETLFMTIKEDNGIYTFDWTNDSARIIYFDESEGILKTISVGTTSIASSKTHP